MYQRAFGVTLTCTRIDGVFATRLIVIAVELLQVGLYRLRRRAYRWQFTWISRRLVLVLFVSRAGVMNPVWV
jgi:hypothetical protein